MKERRYKLDETKTQDIVLASLTPHFPESKQAIWAWLKGKSHIPETRFTKLLSLTGKKPADLLDQESLEFFANASINA
jgi:hypothetical protein